MIELANETFGDQYPFAPHHFDASGFLLHYVDEGEGDPILFVHGDPTWGFLWRSFVAPLAERHRVIVPDHMGMGKSGAPPTPEPYRLADHVANLERLVLSLELGRVTLVVHDWGGPVGLGVATRHPDRFARLVLMNTWAHARWPGAPFPRIVELIRSERGERFALNKNAYVEAALRGTLARTEEALPLFRDRPVLLVWGMQDPVLPPPILDLWRDTFPQAAVSALANASHFLQEDAPGEVLDALDEFLAESSPPNLPTYEYID